ncbi:MAG: acetyl-CoA carboxylase biotin carboxyl carrier protein [Halanaerobiales bacterium]|nr:acetyl-CoA carboxylase biotin carboxyl carrier protein [Halanaerobiales bacterium]
MKISEIKELIKLVNETEITELELEGNDTRLFLRKGRQYQSVPIQQSQISTLPAQESISEVSETPTEEKEIVNGKPILAPMVGTYFSAPRPDADPFVKVGDKVVAGQTLCIIEAMKLMNEIEAEFNGKVVDILVENGQSVEFSQTLFIIESE